LLLGASIDCQDESGKTPLHVSVETAKLEVIKCLIEHQETVQRETELQHVVNPERTVKTGNFLNVPDVDGNTPLHLGVAAGNYGPSGSLYKRAPGHCAVHCAARC